MENKDIIDGFVSVGTFKTFQKSVEKQFEAQNKLQELQIENLKSDMDDVKKSLSEISTTFTKLVDKMDEYKISFDRDLQPKMEKYINKGLENHQKSCNTNFINVIEDVIDQKIEKGLENHQKSCNVDLPTKIEGVFDKKLGKYTLKIILTVIMLVITLTASYYIKSYLYGKKNTNKMTIQGRK